MSAAEAIMAARAAGVRLGIDGDDLVLEAPTPPPDTVLDPLSRYKAEIVALEVKAGKKTIFFDTDEQPRPGDARKTAPRVSPGRHDHRRQRAGFEQRRGGNAGGGSGVCRTQWD